RQPGARLAGLRSVHSSWCPRRRRRRAGRPPLRRSLVVTPLEPLDTAGGVDELLLAREERVAGAADLQTDLVLGGMGLKGVAAGPDHGHHVHRRMDVFLHGRYPSRILRSKNPEA